MPSGRTKALRSVFNPLAPGGATNPATSPFAVGQVSPIYQLGQGPTVSSGIAAFSGSGATAANADGSYIDASGKLRNADGSRKVGAKTLAARDKSWWGKLSTGAKVAIIGGGVALVVVYIAYRKATSPFRYANKVASAVKGVHKAVTGAA